MYYPNYNNINKIKRKKSSDFLTRLINNLSIVLIIIIVFVGLKFVRTDNGIKINNFLKESFYKDYTEKIKTLAIEKITNTSFKPLIVFKSKEFTIDNLPLDGKVIVKFGDKISISKEISEVSKGIVIQTEKASEVKAVFDGIVDKIENNDRYGLVITIDHQNGYKSIYGYLNEIRFTEGEKVKKGDIIGVNAIDTSTKKYVLYFELLQENASVDPQKFIKSNNSAQ